MTDDPRKTLFIPQGVSTRFELISGLGIPEIIKALITAGICGFISFIIYLFNNNGTFIMVALMVSVAFGVTFFRKEDGKLSVADQVWFMIQFARSQKRYGYVKRGEL